MQAYIRIVRTRLTLATQLTKLIDRRIYFHRWMCQSQESTGAGVDWLRLGTPRRVLTISTGNRRKLRLASDSFTGSTSLMSSRQTAFGQRFGMCACEGSSGSFKETVRRDDCAYRNPINKQFIAGQLSAVDFQKAGMDAF